MVDRESSSYYSFFSVTDGQNATLITLTVSLKWAKDSFCYRLLKVYSSSIDFWFFVSF